MDVEQAEIARLVEALLFVADGPVPIEHLATVLHEEVDTVKASLGTLATALSERGVRLVRERATVQLVSAPEASPYVQEFLGLDPTTRLSPAALETLAIIAYRQPVTRAQIEAVRGVNSDAVLRSLIAKSLVEAVGRLEQAGRPVLYGTTHEFLQYFGMLSPADLPPLPESDAPPAASPVPTP
ncbi:MAG: SMC-Scp complex subunit ScpB [Chloroflexi bacterium]|nr:SMC-Scp complex subunit ScpB [Chloroflexota bacterium]